MPDACGRGCPRPFMTELGALTAEPGFCGTRLSARAERIAGDLRHLGESVAVTANTAAVLTRIGCYGAVCRAGDPLETARDATCLRLNAGAIDTTLAVERTAERRMPHSLQFFSAAGAVLHKAFLTQCRDDLDFARLTHRWEAREGAGGAAQGCGPAPCGARGGLARQLDSVLGDGGLTRRGMLPARGGGNAWRVAPEAAFDALRRAADIRMPVVLAVANSGVAQVQAGALEGIRRAGALIVASSGTCTFSCDRTEIEEAWVTRYDAPGGGLMLEFYDWRYHCVAQCAGPEGGTAGLAACWRQMLSSLPRPVAAA